MNIAALEGWIVYLEKKILVIPHCQNLMVKINTRSKLFASFIQVFAAQRTKVLSMTRMLVSVMNNYGKDPYIKKHEILYELCGYKISKNTPVR